MSRPTSADPTNPSSPSFQSEDVTEMVGHKLLSNRLASALEILGDAFALFDDVDRLVLCNSTYRGLFGNSPPSSLVGRSYEELLDVWLGDLDLPDEIARNCFRADRIAQRREPTSTFDIRTRCGRSLRVVDRRTAEGETVTTIRDLTEEEHCAAEQREARAAAEEASAAKSELLSSLSHELRTPLNAILGFARLLKFDKKEALSDRQHERVAQILKGGEHLLRLIDDILDLSRIEAGVLATAAEPVDILHLLIEVTKTLEPMACDQGIGIELATEGVEPPAVSADRTRLAQILMNFGSNAIKYNRRGGKVRFTLSSPGPAYLRISVEDTGLGVGAEQQGRLFQPFQRAGQENGPIEGTGIGLVITKRLAHLMKGNVGFRSVADEGSEFWVELPLHVPGARPAVPA